MRIRADGTASEGKMIYVPLYQIQAAEERIEELERRLALALPAARAAIRWRSPGTYDLSGFEADQAVMDAVDTLAIEEQAEILEGGAG